MADPAKLEEMLKDETVTAVAHLEPVAIDPKVAATKALEACDNDVAKAKEWLAEKIKDVEFKWD
eukprot:CAMPEP_0197870338 /NCGR_PEP_ID=MMETSP1439-20131203/1088_1 /TAXON_ID=66791 /ORGANISM="Gonyaulax spinifera, Strain CCMP409" /LENGTH=63 /DNA_ID=CAMNT_0043489233 /DNA_START=86 /DNA_END=277 /DNA_ORIENTATION=+